MESKQDRDGIAQFVYNRFMERYICPLQAVPKVDQNGFLIMAACCLLIEGLTAFREGWTNTKGLSKRAFALFFQGEPAFQVFRGREEEFWSKVRNGILHQGETAGGWRLNFTRPEEALFVPATLTINCLKFLDDLAGVLAKYRDELIHTPWNYQLWQNLRRKMAATIDDCGP